VLEKQRNDPGLNSAEQTMLAAELRYQTPGSLWRKASVLCCVAITRWREADSERQLANGISSRRPCFVAASGYALVCVNSPCFGKGHRNTGAAPLPERHNSSALRFSTTG